MNETEQYGPKQKVNGAEIERHRKGKEPDTEFLNV